MEDQNEQTSHARPASLSRLAFLTLGALGVVYGDIGTSPLYAVREIFFGHAATTHTQADVLGVISLIFWALTLIVTIKYVIFVLRADSDGEGGVFAIYSLIYQLKKKKYQILLLMTIFASGLLFGDGIITPAISVLSAVEGLTVATPFFTPYIVPITIAILTGLFLIQKKGTAKVGLVFGPIMLTWFIVLALLGLPHILENPQIFIAMNPWFAANFLLSHSIHIVLIVLGYIMLVITGGEAMYADLGHFGKKPIRLGWLGIAYPALFLNYFGQGAYLLSGKPVIEGNLFFSMVPSWGIYPMIALATMATVIASQALISGAFSLTTQAVSLGLFPFLHIKHTHKEHSGQIYVNFINWALYAGSIGLVLYFQSSGRLAAAYGLAVAGDMFVNTIGMMVIAREYWKWPVFAALGLFVPFLFIDSTFLFANSLKFIEGGFIPVSVACVVFFIIFAWRWGRTHVRKTLEQYSVMTVNELIDIKKKAKDMIPRTIVFMTPDPITEVSDNLPALKQMFWERYGMLPKHLIFLTVINLRVPHARHDRYEVTKLFDDPKLGSITGVKVKFGFMEEPHVEETLEGLAAHHEIPVDSHEDWTIHVVHERVRSGGFKNLWNRMLFGIFKFLHRNSDSADHYFGLGRKHPLTIEILPVVVR